MFPQTKSIYHVGVVQFFLAAFLSYGSYSSRNMEIISPGPWFLN
jgi:hypothetical protein